MKEPGGLWIFEDLSLNNVQSSHVISKTTCSFTYHRARLWY